jgi:hypothetical protein
LTNNLTQTIGWQGITIETPPEWAFTGYGGDAQEGSLRVDAPAMHSSSEPAGIEVRWSQPGKEQTEEMLTKRVQSLLNSVEKSGKKAMTDVVTSLGIAPRCAREDRSGDFLYRWKADGAAIGRIWWCKTCGRLVLAQVYGSGSQRFFDNATQILETIGCHGREIGWRTWALYGLKTDIPADFRLDGKQVMNIYLQMEMRKGRSEEMAVVEQWSLANVQLKDVYLDEWAAQKAGNALKSIKTEKSEVTVAGHPALKLQGRRGGLSYIFGEAIPALIRFKLPAVWYEAILWECPETNKAYMVQSFCRRADTRLASLIAERTVCHELA